MSGPIAFTDAHSGLTIAAGVLFALSGIASSAVLAVYGTLRANADSRRHCYLLAAFIVLVTILEVGHSLMETHGPSLLGAQLKIAAGLLLAMVSIAMVFSYPNSPILKRASETEDRAKELQSQVAELKATVQLMMKRQMFRENALRNVSHELRSPLSTLIGMHELLADSSLDETQRQLLTAAADSSNTMRAVIEAIDNLVQIEEGALRIQMIPFNVQSLVREACSACSESARRKKLFLNTDIDPTIPNTVSGDYAHLKQVLVYLISCAVSQTNDGGVTVMAKMNSSGETRPQVTFSIRHTGLALNEEEQREMLEPFSSSPNGKSTRYGDLGLSLYLSRRLIGMLGGKLEANADKGESPGFSFSLLLATPTAGNTTAGNSTNGGSEPTNKS